MRTRASILLSFLLAHVLTLFASNPEPAITIPQIIKTEDGNVYVHYETFRDIAYNNISSVEEAVSNPTQCSISLRIPRISLSYDVPVIEGRNTQLAKLMAKSTLPKIIVRVPQECENAKFVDMVEAKLSRIGFTVIDHKLAEGIVDSREIGRRTGAEVILDISWLQFSEPEMWAKLRPNSVKIDGQYNWQFEDSKLYCKFSSMEDLNKAVKKPKKAKLEWCNTDDIKQYAKIDLVGIENDVLKHINNDNSLNTNKNVVSTIFKFINSKDGSLVGYLQEGYSDNEEAEIPATTIHYPAYNWCWNFGISNDSRYNEYYYVGNNRWHCPWVREELITNRFVGNNAVAGILAYISCTINTDEIPFRKQLNDFREVKLSDEKIQENRSSRTKSNSSYNGSGASYYHRYFSNSRWTGSGRSASQTNSSTTTTFKNAEYLHPSDFFGYYTPLTEKLIKHIEKMMPK